jgi:catechol 2,3-dioxygenase-like lactoylglutathione lyase family enzyme
MADGIRFEAGTNVAMKIPRADYDATVAFYRDTLGMDVEEVDDTGSPVVAASHRVTFGAVTLWLDRVDGVARSDVWLELRTDDLDRATHHLAAAEIHPCDEVEPLDGDAGRTSHWIRNPAGVVHLVAERPGQ